MLASESFTSDLRLFGELDDVAVTSGAASYSRHVIMQFLHSKGWKIEEIATAADHSERSSSPPPKDDMIRPKNHVVVESSESDSEPADETTSKRTLLLFSLNT